MFHCQSLNTNSHQLSLSGAVLVPARGHGHAFREVLVARYADWMVVRPTIFC